MDGVSTGSAKDVPDRRRDSRVHEGRSSTARAARDDEAITELQKLASARASSLGHRLGTWIEMEDREATASIARCRYCDAAVYVRAATGLSGAAGSALSVTCTAAPAS